MINLVVALVTGYLHLACSVQESNPPFPIPVVSSRKLSPGVGIQVIKQSKYGAITRAAVIAEEGDMAWFYRGSLLNLRTGEVDEGMRPVLFRLYPGGEFTPIWLKQLDEARSRAGQKGIVAGSVERVAEFSGGKLTVLLDASIPDPTDPDQPTIPWRTLRVVGEFDCREGQAAGHKVITGWDRHPHLGSWAWVSLDRRLVLGYGKGQYRLGQYGSQFDPSNTPLDLPAAPWSVRRQFTGILSKRAGIVTATSASCVYATAYVTKNRQTQIVEVTVRTGSRVLLSPWPPVATEPAGRHYYVGDTLVDRGPRLDSIPRIWDRRNKKWLGCGHTRILGASPKGTWILVESRGEYWLLKTKWPR